MGNFYKETYTDDILPTLKDWLNNRVVGQNVADIPLSLTNRAQKNVWLLREWQRLFIDLALTVTNNNATLPDDFGREVQIGTDIASSGKVDLMYKREGEIGTGYKITGVFTKAAGTVLTITFFDPLYTEDTIYLRYIPILPNFTGSGTEYSYFPANLIILQSQIIDTREKGKIQENNVLVRSFEDELIKYCNLVQNNNVQHNAGDIYDRTGCQVYTSSYRLDGSFEGSHGYPYPESRRP